MPTGLYTPFKKATRADTPNFAQAAAYQAQIEAEEDARADKRNSGFVTGGVDLYNQFMGDDTPIRDYGRSMLGLDPVAGVANAAATSGELATAMQSLNAGVLAPEAMGIMGGALPSTAASLAAGEAGMAAAGAGGAGAAGMGALGPVGIALALASLLFG